MSWFDGAGPMRLVRGGARWTALAAALAVTTIATVGCSDGSGFRPVHGVLASGQTTDDRLRDVEVAVVPGRVGQRIRNEIQYATNESENTATPVYRLDITLSETLHTTLVRSDGLSSSQIYQATAAFKLTRINDKQVLLEGRSVGRAPFERNASIYANVRAREDAENRAAKSIGTDISKRLATYLSRPAN